MPDIGDAHWTFVDLPDGHSYEVWRKGSTLRDADVDLYGRVTATMQGYEATDRSGSRSGPFPTLDEAAYPLALQGAAAAQRLAIQRQAEAHGRPPVLIALAAVLAARALLALVRRR